MTTNEIAGAGAAGCNHADSDYVFISAIFYGLLTVFGFYTFIYHLAMLLSWSLGVTTIVSAVFLIIPVVFKRRPLIVRFRAAVRGMRHREGDFSLFYVAGLGVVTALVCLLVSKFNEDDSFYMSRAVLDWDNWWHPIVVDYPFAFTSGAGGIFTSLPSFEHFVASIAGLTGTHPLDIYFFAAPVIVGFILPFAWYLGLLRVGLSRHGAFMGAAFIVILMLLDGTTIRGIANFSLFRIWQGKVVLLSVVTPLALAATLDAVDDGRAGDWIKLLLIGVVGIGLSTTAAFFLPVMVGIAGFAWWLTKPTPAGIWHAPVASLAVFLYPALCILPLYRSVSGQGMAFASPLAFNLTDTLKLVYGPTMNPTLIAALLGVLGLLATRRFRVLVWLTLWAVMIAFPLAWPPAASLIVRYGTSSDALWRLAYASPVILTVGLGLGACCEARLVRRMSGVLLAGGAACVIAAALLQVDFSPFAAANVVFPTLAYKIPPDRLAVARAMVRDLPAGTMLAPASLSVILPLISSSIRLTNFRDFDAPLQLLVDGHPGQADALEKAFEYVSGLGGASGRADAFRQVAGWGPNYVVLEPGMHDSDDAIALLKELRYREVMIGITVYRVFQRATISQQTDG